MTKPTGRKRGNPNWSPNPSGIPAGGAGWGGPAKGEAKPFSAEHQPQPEARAAGYEAAKTARAAAAEHAITAVEVWRSIMTDPNQPAAARVIAADKMVTRAEGAPEQTVRTPDLKAPEAPRRPIGELIAEALRSADAPDKP